MFAVFVKTEFLLFYIVHKVHKKLYGTFPQDMVKDVSLQKEKYLRKNTCNQT